MPSPVDLKLACGEECKGYVNSRKDSVAWEKNESVGWIIVHRVSGYRLDHLPPRNSSYTDFSNLCAKIQTKCAADLKELDALGHAFNTKDPRAVGPISRIRAYLDSLTNI